jgi:hypothetical protein
MRHTRSFLVKYDVEMSLRLAIVMPGYSPKGAKMAEINDEPVPGSGAPDGTAPDGAGDASDDSALVVNLEPEPDEPSEEPEEPEEPAEEPEVPAEPAEPAEPAAEPETHATLW